jgi:hypothetical protein
MVARPRAGLFNHPHRPLHRRERAPGERDAPGADVRRRLTTVPSFATKTMSSGNRMKNMCTLVLGAITIALPA